MCSERCRHRTDVQLDPTVVRQRRRRRRRSTLSLSVSHGETGCVCCFTSYNLTLPLKDKLAVSPSISKEGASPCLPELPQPCPKFMIVCLWLFLFWLWLLVSLQSDGLSTSSHLKSSRSTVCSFVFIHFLLSHLFLFPSSSFVSFLFLFSPISWTEQSSVYNDLLGQKKASSSKKGLLVSWLFILSSQF